MDFFDYIQFLWGKRKRIALILLVNAILIVVITLLLPNKYTARVKVLPPTDNSIGGGLDRYASIASMLGVNLGGSTQFGPVMFESIIKSRKILEPIIYKNYKTLEYKNREINLIEYFDISGESDREKFEKCMEHMRNEIISVLVNPENFITTIGITTKEAQLSAKIAKLVLDNLQNFNLKIIQKEALDKRRFIKNRLGEITDSLKYSENKLVDFLNNVSDPTLPIVQVVLNKKQREIEILSSILIELRKQAEILKLQEFSDLKPLQILEYPYAPALKSFPKRAVISILYMLGISVIIFAIYMMIFFRKNYQGKKN
ncbi:MAG TPA: hypothetical protein ENK44_01655 [Caldithrix abyssi]|uniref:Polysaccharide chain length determinant N-terminal domain-containing protein n=1 Tax=Caldithrix abyssi TaxID=187145 RepID=A0A7V4U033_CALAY|nr:hypothetical protein [Caldithrix abyssi]